MSSNFDFAKAYKYKLSKSNDLDMDAHIVDNIIKEGVDKVDLSSFKLKKELNPDVWVNNKLNSKIRLRLLDIADDFIDTLSTDWVKPKDIILIGSMANYNWSKYSDFDLHILIDFKQVDKRTEFVGDYFNAKKEEWNSTHEELMIYGHPVEVYVQDINEECEASGIYSLEKNKWIKEPEEDAFKSIELDKGKIVSKSKEYMKIIDNLEKMTDSINDDAQLREISTAVKKTWDKIRKMRKEDLKKNGEMSIGNIIYKVLRRTGYIETIFTLKAKTYDKIMSID